MLHNSGPYGPNDVPVNMGAPLNMSQMNGSMNIAHNLNNLGKMPQQPSQTSSGLYNMPDYSTFGHPPLSTGSPIGPFQNYHQFGFQPNYMSQTPNLLHDTNLNNVQNCMMPMNLNVQSDHGANMLNYHNYFDNKKASESLINNEYKEPISYRKNMPINIPQIHTKAFQKHIGMENDHINNYSYYSANQDNYRHYLDGNINLCTKTLEKSEQDLSRRKSLENTVKLIENILINTTSASRTNDTSSNRDTNANLANKIETETAPKEKPIADNESNDKCYDSEVSQEEQSKKQDEDTGVIEQEQESSSEEEQDVKPTALIAKFDETEQEIEPNIIVKVEPVMSWTDVEHTNPFHRDVNGLTREDTGNCKIVDADNSVNEAMDVIKNGHKSDSYFECPNCSLLFENPKRFLIHAKWHSFGLTNDKRIEMAKEKELQRSMRREARLVERMNSKEVKDFDSNMKTYPCKDCDKIFSGKGSLKNHRQRFHPTQIRECKICKKTVLGWMALRAHLATHTNDTGYQCSECPKRFKYAHSLAKHRDTHLEKTHGCEQCPKMFGSAALLKMHLKVHERALRGATFRCTYCGKGFYESYNLQVHERTHRNERPFLCEICNTSFGTNSSLKRHLKVSHSTSKPYECGTCHRSFITESILERHERRVHGDPDDFKFKCKQCQCRYLKLKDLQKHMYKVHPKGKRKRLVESDSE